MLNDAIEEQGKFIGYAGNLISREKANHRERLYLVDEMQRNCILRLLNGEALYVSLKLFALLFHSSSDLRYSYYEV